jgi:hypothetical protein
MIENNQIKKHDVKSEVLRIVDLSQTETCTVITSGWYERNEELCVVGTKFRYILRSYVDQGFYGGCGDY